MSQLLRYALLVDAGATAVTGLLMLLASSWLEPMLGIPATLLFYTGVVLLGYAAAVGFLGTRPAPPPVYVWCVIVCNLFWAADTLLAVSLGWIAVTGIGRMLVIGQAIAVLVLAELQYVGLRRGSATRRSSAALS